MAACTFAVGTADTGNTPNTSGSFTPAIGDLLVVFAVLSASTGSTDPAITCSTGMTFTNAFGSSSAFVLFASSVNGISCWVSNSLVTAGQAVSQTVTVDPSDAANGSNIFVFRVSGMTKTGLQAVLQEAHQENQAAGTPAPAFASSCNTNNPTLGCIGNSSSPAGMTVPTGWTEPAGGDIGYSTPTTGGQVVFRNSGFTGTTITWGNSSATAFGSYIIELDASAPSGPSIPVILNQYRARTM